jgi:hypothetical protein
MKKLVLIVSFFFILSSIALAQHVIENPEKPLSKKAGRVLKLEEVFRITDESDDFYFSRPLDLKVYSEGSFFLLDENQILKFSSDGKFLKNLFKKGQGPGEISSSSHSRLSYFLFKNSIFLYDPTGNKIIHMDGDGNLIEEVKLEVSLLSELYGPANEGFIFVKEAPSPLGKSGFHDVDMSIIWVSRDGSSSKKVMALPKELYVYKNFARDWAPFYGLLESDAQNLFVCHTSEYNIVLADLGKGQVIKKFNRKYRRIKYVMTESQKQSYERIKIKPPERKYKNDIVGLFLNKDNLWVKTSTKDEKKGALIDVFNKEGKFIDNFYLNLKGELMAVQGDFIFVNEKDEEENIQIVKYKIIG